MPYAKSGVSMMVHRIGKTLLIDQFDVYKHVLMAQQVSFFAFVIFNGNQGGFFSMNGNGYENLSLTR